MHRLLAGVANHLVLSYLSLGVSIFGAATSAAGVAGWEGTLPLLVTFALAALLPAGVLLALRPFRWALVYSAVRQACRAKGTLAGVENSHVVAVGSGGMIATGILLKALQEEGKAVASTHVCSVVYDAKGQPTATTPAGLPSSGTLFLVASYAGTGSTLDAARASIGSRVDPIEAIAFVASHDAVTRKRVQQHLVEGPEWILPWPRTR